MSAGRTGRIKFRADVLRRKLPAEADELDRRCKVYVTDRDSELSLFVGVRLLRILGRLPEHVFCTLEACDSLNSVPAQSDGASAARGNG